MDDGELDGCATPLSAAAATNHILTDDAYGLADAYDSLGGRLYVPTVGVGRLVETPEQIAATIDRFVASDGLLEADTTLTGGYGAWAELPDLVTEQLAWRTASGTALAEPWTKTDVESALFPAAGQSPRVVSVNTHADETRMLYYNKDMFQKAGLDPNTPPTTWDEVEKDAKALKSVVSVPWSAPMSKQYVTVQTFMSVYLSYGAQLFNSQGQCGLDTPAFKDALTWYTGIAKQGLTSPDAANQTGDDLANLFSNGKAGMLVDGPSRYNAIKSQNPDLFKNIGVAPIPAGPKGQFGFLGGWPLVMWNTSQHKDAAAKWIHYATSPDGALSKIAETSGILPGRKSLAEKAPWTEAPYDAFAKQLSQAYPYQYPAGPSPKMGEIETASIQTAVQQVATGAANVNDATKQLCTDIDNILAK